MPLIRGEHSFDKQFVQIPNAWLRDTRLSFRAKGLLAMMMTHQVGWSLSIDSIARENPEGKDAIRSAVKELEQLGYLVRYQPNNGRFSESVWKTQDPLAENPSTENPSTEKPQAKNTISKNTNLENIKNNAFATFWAVYPRKTGKLEALKAFTKALEKIGFDQLLVAVQRYANDPYLPEAQFIPHASTWLNQERWEDGALPPRQFTKEELAEKQRQAALEREKANKEANDRYQTEMAELERLSAPPPKCPHGEAIIHCKKCLYATG